MFFIMNTKLSLYLNYLEIILLIITTKQSYANFQKTTHNKKSNSFIKQVRNLCEECNMDRVYTQHPNLLQELNTAINLKESCVNQGLVDSIKYILNEWTRHILFKKHADNFQQNLLYRNLVYNCIKYQKNL